MNAENFAATIPPTTCSHHTDNEHITQKSVLCSLLPVVSKLIVQTDGGWPWPDPCVPFQV
jgi:hypothetical protein